jgi:transforming growth factor-beta-induced protein
MTTWLSKLGASALMLSISAVAMAQSSTDTITQNVVAVDRFSTLETAVVKAGLDTTLGANTEFTVFAPNNAAFTAAGTAATDLLVDGMEDELANVLTYHVVPGKVMAADLTDGQMIETVQGQMLEVAITGSTVMVGGATVVMADIESSNGVIHEIDSVLLPAAANTMTLTENVVAMPNSSTLEAAVVKAGLATTLGGDTEYTVFAPDNAAFTAAGTAATDLMVDGMETELANVLTYHVVAGKVMAADLSDGQMIETVQGEMLEVSINGSTVMVGGATVTAADVEASNGVIHVIDAVLMPPSTMSDTSDMTLTDIVIDMDDFSTLEAALVKASLASTFAGSDEYTVFAPDNAAFTAAGTAAANLMMDGMESELSAVLQYHVVAGKVMAADLSDGQMIETLNGAELMVEIDNGTVMIDGATVTMADVEASNGVIHRIDAVLMPGTNAPDYSDQTIAEVVIGMDNFSTLEAALAAAGLVDTFNGTTKYTVFAPTNMAFADIQDTVDTLLMAGNEADLASVLTFHVVAGEVMAGDLTDGMMVDTLNGQQLEVNINSMGEVRINGAMITMADVQTSNGVIHVIDNVLIPKNLKPTQSLVTGKDAVSEKILIDAIDVGVDLFNADNEKACAAIYRIAVMSVLEIEPKVFSKKDLAMFKKTLISVDASDDQRANAWSLRRVMNAMLSKLSK